MIWFFFSCQKYSQKLCYPSNYQQRYCKAWKWFSCFDSPVSEMHNIKGQVILQICTLVSSAFWMWLMCVERTFLNILSFLLYVCSFLTDLSVMVRQVNTVLCSEVGSYSTTHCCLYDQSVPTTGKVLVLCQWETRFGFVLYTEGEKVSCFIWRCYNTVVILRLFLNFRNLWWNNSGRRPLRPKETESPAFNGQTAFQRKE